MSFRRVMDLTDALGTLVNGVDLSQLGEPTVGFWALPRDNAPSIDTICRNGTGRVWWVEYTATTLNQDAGTATEWITVADLVVGYAAGADYSPTTASELIQADAMALIAAVDYPVDPWPDPILTVRVGQTRVEEIPGEGRDGQIISARLLRIPLEIEHTTTTA